MTCKTFEELFHPFSSRFCLILDSQDYSLIQVLDVDSAIGFENRNPVFVKIAMNREYMFANVSLNIGGTVIVVKNHSK